MSLNWNISKCKDWKRLADKKGWPVTDKLVWATMAVGMGEITERNYEEFYRRLHIIEQNNGTFFLQHNGQPRYITLAEVKRRIGLYTNVGTITKAKFDAKHKAPAATEA